MTPEEEKKAVEELVRQVETNTGKLIHANIITLVCCKDTIVRNVQIGDKFKRPGRSEREDIYTVVDFHETRSMTTGEVINQTVIAEHNFCGQQVKTDGWAFATVIRYKI